MVKFGGCTVCSSCRRERIGESVLELVRMGWVDKGVVPVSVSTLSCFHSVTPLQQKYNINSIAYGAVGGW
uniref:Peptidase A1 domain-containing protein n=1 Tax=Syphacia muris TaxID=451379 RepID=A0A0N5AT38_9BILA